MERREWTNPLWVLAWGCFGLAVLWGLSLMLPPVIKAIGAAVGLGVATATTGFATAGVTAGWLPTVATGSMAVAAIGTVYLVVERATEKGMTRPFEWVLPMFVILTGLMVDLTKDSLFANGTQKALYVAATSGLLLVGGILLRQPRVVIRVMGAALPFLPILAVWMLASSRSQQRSTIHNVLGAGTVAGWGLVGSAVVAIVVIILAIFLPQADQ